MRVRLGALHAPLYRRYWLGSLASIGATQLLILGKGWLVFDQFVEGLRFIGSSKLFSILIPLTWMVTFFGVSNIQLMPAFAEILGVGERGFGFLLSASGVGSVTGTILIVLVQNTRRLGVHTADSGGSRRIHRDTGRAIGHRYAERHPGSAGRLKTEADSLRPGGANLDYPFFLMRRIIGFTAGNSSRTMAATMIGPA